MNCGEKYISRLYTFRRKIIPIRENDTCDSFDYVARMPFYEEGFNFLHRPSVCGLM